ncbi:MAG: hypothetical protein CMF61_00380 [Magnetococcales bacterium]|nr:hypothetical protein [Magnetococcales bacterium]PPR11959.1 MAG: hypothetical protein CFH43_01162 [Pseudomonadota bacterium]|tara:strand:- start:56 stop:358 length:303 start_codon:yes stop_codon:yes gene_type:complete
MAIFVTHDHQMLFAFFRSLIVTPHVTLEHILQGVKIKNPEIQEDFNHLLQELKLAPCNKAIESNLQKMKDYAALHPIKKEDGTINIALYKLHHALNWENL